MSIIDDYRKIGYVIIGSECLGELKGLSPKNSLYSDIRLEYYNGLRIFVSDINKTVILSKDADFLYKEQLRYKPCKSRLWIENLLHKNKSIFKKIFEKTKK